MSKYSFLQDNFLKRGLKIFPVVANGKTPLINTWQLDASCEREQLLYWLEEGGNDINIGLPATPNNLFVIDVDMHDGVNGLESFHNLLNDCGVSIDEVNMTLRQTTPSGGIHFIFASDDELKKVRNTSNSFGEKYQGIDIRTSGYIVVEPSVVNGVPYKFSSSTASICEMPSALREFILNNVSHVNDTKKGGVSEDKEDHYYEGKVVNKGSRDENIYNYIYLLYNKKRLSRDETRVLAYVYNERCFKPPLSQRVIDYKLNKAFEKPRRKQITIILDDAGEGVEKT